MTAAAFWLPNDAEERAELAEYGITVSDDGALQLGTEQCQRDATASQLLRKLGEHAQDLTRYADAKAAEITLIVERYDKHIAPVENRVAVLVSIVRQIALDSDFGNAKSRKLSYGTYGVRTVPERIAVIDSKRLLSWARLVAPDLVSVKSEERVLQSAVEKHVKSSGEIPEGCDVTPEHSEPFFRLATQETTP